jgi:hypothetical protein
LEFEPEDFLALLERERRWFELLMLIGQRRGELYPHRMEDEVITLMLQDRARHLRN